jgi:hypothetical protein
VVETTACGAGGTLVNAVDHGQRHDSLFLVVDDVEVCALDFD